MLENKREEIARNIEKMVDSKRLALKETAEQLRITSQILSAAKEQGDLSENSEYQDAVAKVKSLNGIMENLSVTISAFERFEQPTEPAERLRKGSIVRFLIVEENKEIVAQLVPEGLGDMSINALDISLAIGERLLGESIGSEFQVVVPKRKVTIRVLEAIY